MSAGSCDAARRLESDPGGLSGAQSGALASSLRESRVRIDESSHIEDADDGKEEDGQNQGELDETLTPFTSAGGLGEAGSAHQLLLTVMFELQRTIEPAISVWRWMFLSSVSSIS